MLEKHIRLYDITYQKILKYSECFTRIIVGSPPNPPPPENVNDGGHGGIKHSGPAKSFQYLRLSWMPREQMAFESKWGHYEDSNVK
ncbi:hypothetical protein M8J76_014462 [Diaphorina citri]|nr:hypothetical protein M8J76_014462 [Diaphorina citri]